MKIIIYMIWGMYVYHLAMDIPIVASCIYLQLTENLFLGPELTRFY